MKLPKYRLHKASGRAVIFYKPLFGNSAKYLPGTFGSKESRRAYAKLLSAVMEHKLKTAPPSRPLRVASVDQLLIAYLDFARQHYGPKNSEFVCIAYAADVVSELCGGIEPDEFGPLALKDVRQKMIAMDWSRGYVNHQVARIRRAFRWGVENELIKSSVLESLRAVAGLRRGKTVARETEAKRPVDWSVVQMVLPFVSPIIAVMIELQWLTGMRSSELCGLEPNLIDQSADVWVYRPVKHKTAWMDKTKAVCFGRRAQELLLPYLAATGPDQFIFRPELAMQQETQRRNENRTSKRYGQRATKARRLAPHYNHLSYRNAIARGFDKAEAKLVKIPHWHPHQLRHTRATITRAAYGIEGAQAQIGNTLEVTELYAEKSLALAQRIARDTG